MGSDYPIGTVALYGPTDKQATKLVAGVVPAERAAPSAMKKWFAGEGDIREDATVQSELSVFLKAHHVTRAVVTEEVIGCPHEEGIDYPKGTSCPLCPFWTTKRKARGLASKAATPGRNAPCSCGSGKEFKKCCGK